MPPRPLFVYFVPVTTLPVIISMRNSLNPYKGKTIPITNLFLLMMAPKIIQLTSSITIYRRKISGLKTKFKLLKTISLWVQWGIYICE